MFYTVVPNSTLGKGNGYEVNDHVVFTSHRQMAGNPHMIIIHVLPSQEDTVKNEIMSGYHV